MSTLGWVFILAAGLVMRAVARGRVMNISEDLSDAFLAMASGDTKGFTEVLARVGDSNAPTIAEPPHTEGLGDAPGGGQAAVSNDLLKNAMALGGAAKGYRLTATGPDYYDCSGLVWQALKRVGYKGVRFTTATVKLMSGGQLAAVTGAPAVGDIVLWPAHHMGIVSGANKFYSARSVKSGIGESSIKGFRTEAPQYLRYVGKS